MTPTLALLTLLLASSDAAPPAAAPPAPGSCQSFTRASPGTPPSVRDWLAHSGDDRVLVCTPSAAEAAAPLYTGESAVSRHDAVCSYHSHGLLKVGRGAAGRLERYDRGDALQMALADGDCPPPHGAAAGRLYVTTYDISPAAFVAIMRLWAQLAASTEAFDRACCEPGTTPAGTAPPPAAAEARRRLRAAIDGGRMQTAAVARIVRISGSTLRRRYALFVADPDRPADQPGFYVIYLSKRLRGPYQLTGIADTLG